MIIHEKTTASMNRRKASPTQTLHKLYKKHLFFSTPQALHNSQTFHILSFCSDKTTSKKEKKNFPIFPNTSQKKKNRNFDG